MKKRIFIALTISKELQGKILKWERRYRKLPARWLNGKNLHITLIPPWYEEDVERVKKSLRHIRNKVQPFKIEFQKVSYGPDPRRPHLIWAEGKTPKKLLVLKRELERILRKKSEKRPFRLHLTLARFRPEDFRGFPIKKIDEKVLWKDAIDAVVLMESHLSRSGADYEVLERVSLK